MRLIKILVLVGVVLLIGSSVALASGQLRQRTQDPDRTPVAAKTCTPAPDATCDGIPDQLRDRDGVAGDGSASGDQLRTRDRDRTQDCDAAGDGQQTQARERSGQQTKTQAATQTQAQTRTWDAPFSGTSRRVSVSA